MIITVCGIGYSGLMLSLFLCELGHTVKCFDSNPDVLNAIQIAGNQLNINEPGINSLVKNYIQSGNLNLFNNISHNIGTCAP